MQRSISISASIPLISNRPAKPPRVAPGARLKVANIALAVALIALGLGPTVVDGWWLAWRVGHDRIFPLAPRAWGGRGRKAACGGVRRRRRSGEAQGFIYTSYAGQSTDGCFTPLPEYELDQQVNS